MEIKAGVTVAVIVDSRWSHRRAIERFLGPPDKPGVPSDGAHLILARLLDDKDEHGLWIELNSARHREDASIPLWSLLIPWQWVLAIVVDPDVRPEQEPRFGFAAEQR